jgi:ankyrin repeat protein
LHIAVQKDQAEAVRELLKSNQNVSIFNIQNNTPLHIAAQNGNINIIQILAKEATGSKNRFVSRLEPNGHGDAAIQVLSFMYPELLTFDRNLNKWTGNLVSDRKLQLKDNALYYLLDMLQSENTPSVRIDLQSLEDEHQSKDIVKSKPKISAYSKDSACKLGLGLFFKLPEELKVQTMQFLSSGPHTYTSKEDDKARRIAKCARTSRYLFESK